jgi:3-oxoacyl-[acyl-carrier protein] reductase
VCRRLEELGLEVVATRAPFDAEPADAIAVDLADPDAPRALFDRIERERGRAPTVLVNNAAHSERDGWLGLDAAGLDAHYAVNTRASALLAVELCRRLPGDRAGRIVSLVTGQFQGPMPDELAYVASKGAIDAFTITLAAEVASLGVTVNTVNPGPVDTGWMDDAVRAEVLAAFPMGRIGEADDPARLIAFLVSDEARWITGQRLSTEGGFVR